MQLLEAARSGHADNVLEVLDEGADVEFRDEVRRRICSPTAFLFFLWYSRCEL
jgi:hypothetical protein